MCGLFGWQFNKATLPSKRQRRKLAKALTWHMDKRGGQQWGCWSDGRVTKGTGDANNHVKHFARAAVLMGHTRYATHGDKNNIDHAHPFRHGSMLLSHNGVLSNHAALNIKYERKHEVDSQHLLSHLVEGRTFEDIEGYGVVTYLDETKPDSVRLIRLRDRGDLAVAKTAMGVVWASTKEAVREALEYADIEAEFYYDIVPGAVHMAEEGALFIDKTAPDMKVAEPHYYHDWRKGAVPGMGIGWLADDDSDSWGHWDRMAAGWTPPMRSIQLGAEVDDMTGWTDEDQKEWDLAVEVEKATLWLEENAGVTDAAFDGMKAEEILDAAFDMGWAGYDPEEEVLELA